MENVEHYLDELESLLDNILNWKVINPEEIKRTQFNRVFHRVEEFSKSYLYIDDRQEFVDTALFRIIETGQLISDYEHTDYNERLSLIESIKDRFVNLFPDITPANNPLSLSAKIILLDYLGVTKMLEDKGLNQKQQAALWGSLLDRSPENTKKALSKVGGRIGKSTSVKNETSLRSVKDIADKLKFKELNTHIDRDLDILNQSKQKKG